MAKYYFGWTSKEAIECGTEKAWLATYSGGYTRANDEDIYIPRSIMRVDEPNEYGNVRVFIPVWFFKKNLIAYYKIREIDWGESGVSPLVELGG